MSGLELMDLSVGYGGSPVVQPTTLRVDAGRTLGIVGESGSGKTTLARALGRHLPENGEVLGGRILVDGVDVLALTPRELRRWRRSDVAFVHQEAGATLDPTMRIGRQLAEVLALQERPRSDVPELLAQVRLPAEVARRYPFELSGGQQQRVVIAAALASRPRLLVLDEPTTGLDASVEAEILGLLDDLRRTLSATVVLISHDLGLVGELCDDVAVVYGGRVVEHGTAAAVLTAPRHPYTAALLGAAPTLGVPRARRRLTAIAGRPPVPGPTVGCRFAPRCPFADAQCESEEPAEVGSGHTVRCHHTDRLDVELRTLAAPPLSSVKPPGGQGRPEASHREVATSGARLEVRGLTRRYGKHVAVDDVSFDVRPAEVFGLVGESGSGKTTVARSVAGLPAGVGEGTVTVDSTERRAVQMVFQQPDGTLNPAQRVRTVLARALATLGGKGTVEQLAERTQVEPALLPARTTSLSGGQKQRVAIARAFAGNPAVVVCDEPVSALDVSVQAGVLELLAEQRERTGTSYLFISHDLAVVGYLADRVGVMYAGQLVELGTTADVLGGPHHPYTNALVAAATTRSAPDAPAAARETGAGCRFAARCPHHLGPRCAEEAPPLRPVAGDQHLIRCHLPLDALPIGTHGTAEAGPSTTEGRP